MINFQIKENLKSMKTEQELYKKIKDLLRMEILVGIPEKTSPRKKGEMNNATLLMIHTNGSPLRNLPARPLLEPALTAPDNQAKIVEDLRMVATFALSNNIGQAKRMMKTTGQDAVSIIQNWFEDPRNGWAQDSPLTIKRKLMKKKGKERQQALERFSQGDMSVNDILFDTGQMKKAINFIFRDKETGEDLE